MIDLSIGDPVQINQWIIDGLRIFEQWRDATVIQVDENVFAVQFSDHSCLMVEKYSNNWRKTI